MKYFLLILISLFPLFSFGFTAEEAILSVNKDRLDNKVKMLTVDSDLTLQAQERAKYLYDHNQWSHEGWTVSFRNSKYAYEGENLAKDFVSTSTLNTAWLNSPAHRQNIINPNYSYTGIGIYKNYVVQLFGGYSHEMDKKTIRKND